jgi:signal transduction histidine kinase
LRQIPSRPNPIEMTIHKLTGILLIQLLVSFSALAQNGIPANSITFFSDTTDQLPFDTVRGDRFQRHFTSGVDFERNPTVWMKITVPSDVPVGESCLRLVTSYYELYYHEEGEWKVQKNGTYVAPAERSVPLHPFYVCFAYSPSEPVIFVKVPYGSELDGQPAPLTFESKEQVESTVQNTVNVSFLIMGSMIVFILCTFAFYLILQDLSSLLFAMFLFFFYVMMNRFFLSALFGDLFPVLLMNEDVGQIYFVLGPVSLLLFSRSFFQISEQSTFWRRTFWTMIALAIPCLVTIKLGNEINSLLILCYNVIVSTLVCVYSGVAHYKFKFKPARYFLVGCLVPMAVIVLIVLDFFHVLRVANLELVSSASVLLLSSILGLGVVQRFRQMNVDLLRVTLAKINKEHEAELFKLRNTELVTYNTIIESQKKQIEGQARKLEESNGNKDMLLSILAHDLRGPVGNLQSILTLLSDKLLTPDEFHALSDRLKKDVEGTFNMLDDVLRWVKAQQEGIQSRPVDFDIHELLKEAVDLAMLQAKTKGIIFEIMRRESVRVHADRDQVHIILRNLLNNAIKFAPAGTKVFVSASSENDLVKINIKDQGIGIRPEIIEKIMQGEKIASTRGTAGEKGTGLGLLLCQEFIHQNGGRLYLESQLNQGTTISFSLRKA